MANAQTRWRMVALLPGLVMGPPLSAAAAETQSIHVMRRMLRGDMCRGFPQYYLRTVDVRDVAKAHALAMVLPNASGRYLLTPHEFTFDGVGRVIAAGPLGADRCVRLRLPKKGVGRAVLWLIADIINIERYRLWCVVEGEGGGRRVLVSKHDGREAAATHTLPLPLDAQKNRPTFEVPLRVDGSRAERELGITEWVPREDAYREMAATMVALGMCAWMNPQKYAPLIRDDSIAPFVYDGPWKARCW
jgi:hypothetical protein